MVSSSDLEYVRTAQRVAAYLHRGQKRKASGDPYISHPKRVVHLLRVAGVDDPDILAVGWLHDTLEDTTATADDLSHKYGFWPVTVRSVEALTRGHEKDNNIYLARAMAGAPLVKMADRIDNLLDGYRTLGMEWLQRYLTKTQTLLEIAALQHFGHPLQIILSGVVSQLEEMLEDVS